MMRLIGTVLIACLAVTIPTLPVQAASLQSELVSREEALTVANNWIALITHYEGNWGGAQTARVSGIQEFRRGARVLGHFCSVEPQGFVLISLRRELAPVRAYSAVSDLDPDSEQGMADVLKGRMEGILDFIEEQLGPLALVRGEDLERILKINYRRAWEELNNEAASFEKSLASRRVTDYQAGGELLWTFWGQDPPYNDDCPWMDCANSNGRAVVGCVATAGAQIMRYWSWPPQGEGSPYDDAYDWHNMPSGLTSFSRQVQIDAVAELCAEVADAVGTTYGCEDSTAYSDDMEAVYEQTYYYSTDCARRSRSDHDADEWFDYMKAQFNLNRPVLYSIPGHALVGDGWREVSLGGQLQKEYHMNYGDGTDAWYPLDEIEGGFPPSEYMLEDIYPVRALGDWVSGWYHPTPFPGNYVYFDRDASGTDATFDAGYYVQFLPEVTVTCTSASGGSIRFLGSSGSEAHTYLFTGGDPTRGIEIRGGHIYLYQDGSIKLYRQQSGL